MLKLIQWQWEGYTEFHRSKLNLLMHIILVPGFICANLYLIFSLINGRYLLALLSLASMGLSIALQGLGHKQEAQPSIPFIGAINAVSRLLIEQWINFPRFVISGGWWRALQHAA
ncbi:terminase [Undibacterium sp. Di24W]|uniref:terminase n=1 Tax=Undibacterium sp. Di24W TaxID=3413033 RepID=UPI003BF25402